MLVHKVLSFAVAAIASLSFSSAFANTVTSNDFDCLGNPITRVFSLTAVTVNKCLLKGAGNLTGNATGDAFLTSTAGTGFELIDKSDSTGGTHDGWLTGTPVGLQSGLGGTFTINAAAYGSYDFIAIAFKVGVGQADPDYAVFLLDTNTLSGDWSVTGQQALSHALIYGSGDGTTIITRVPEPASLALVGAAVLAVGAARRRKA